MGNARHAKPKGPFTIVLFDANDAAFFAEIYDEEERMKVIDVVEEFGLAKELADALFVLHNYTFKSFAEMLKQEAGYDARVYDVDYNCLYKAHEKYSEHWIGFEKD